MAGLIRTHPSPPTPAAKLRPLIRCPPFILAPPPFSQSNGALSFLRVFDAGHMVPRDQPVAAVEMVDAFTSGKI
jgi:hypothetical protein